MKFTKSIKQLTKHQFWTIPAILIIDSLFFGTTDPQKVDSLLLIIGYILMVTTVASLLRGLSRFASLYGIPRAYSCRFSDITTIVLAILLALSSVGELSSRDMVVIIPFGLLFYIYLSYAKTRKV